MKARDVFGIIVRTIGLLLVIHSLTSLQVLLILPSGFSGGSVSGGGITVSGFWPGGFFVSFLFEAALGLALLLGANVIVTLAYRRPSLRPPSNPPRPVRPKRRRAPVDVSAAPDFDSLGEKLGDDFEPRVD